jgi:hypothetical protein
LGAPAGGGDKVLADLVDSGNSNYDGYVPTWYGQTPNINNASNSTASEQPQIVNSGSVIKENGKPAIDFDGSDDTLTISTTTAQFLPLNFTAFLVASQVNTGENFGELVGTNQEFLYGFLDGDRNVAIFTEDTQNNNTLVKSITLSSDNKQHWRYYERNSNELFVQINKEPVANNNNAPTSNTLLEKNLFLEPKQNKNCKFQEFIYFDKSGVDKNQLRSNQNNFYKFPTF